MKKIGYSLIFFGAIATTYIVLNCANKKNNNKNINSPTIAQYLNRLIEFFDSDSIDLAEDNFLNLVDFGISLNGAFESTVFGEQ